MEIKALIFLPLSMLLVYILFTEYSIWRLEFLGLHWVVSLLSIIYKESQHTLGQFTINFCTQHIGSVDTFFLPPRIESQFIIDNIMRDLNLHLLTCDIIRKSLSSKIILICTINTHIIV